MDNNWQSGKPIIILVLAGLFLVRLLMALIPARVRIGLETTVIDSPLRPDGTPDYAAYLNDQWSTGVTPDNNAVVGLIRVFGPDVIDADIREAYFEKLGIEIPNGPSDFLDFRDFVIAQAIVWNGDVDRIKALEDKASRAQSEPWTPEDYPEVAAWLEAHQQTISAIIDASECPRFFSPLIPRHDESLFSTRMPLERQTRLGVRLLINQAMLELGRGNVDRACELTLACHRLSRLVSENPTFIGHLVSYEIDAVATAGDQGIVLTGLLTVDQAKAYRQKLGTLRSFRSMVDVLDCGERLVSLGMIVTFYAGRVREQEIQAPPQMVKCWFDPNPALRRFNALYDEMAAALALPDRADRRRALDDLDRKYSTVERPSALQYGLALFVGRRSFISEQVGQVLCELSFSPVQHADDAEERAQIRVLLTDAGYALAAYRADHGAFPDTLNPLVPDLLPAVPLDPVTGDPLQYTRKDDGFLLYSMGNNGIDDGGLMRGYADDIAFGITAELPNEE